MYDDKKCMTCTYYTRSVYTECTRSDCSRVGPDHHKHYKPADESEMKKREILIQDSEIRNNHEAIEDIILTYVSIALLSVVLVGLYVSTITLLLVIQNPNLDSHILLYILRHHPIAVGYILVCTLCCLIMTIKHDKQ